MKNQQLIIPRSSSSLISNSTLILIAFATAFFPRIIDQLGFPSAINFLHFAVVLVCSLIIIANTRVKDKNQISLSWSLLSAIIIFLGIITASALLNRAGVINAILSFLLLAEPFIFLLAIISIPISSANFQKFRRWLLAFALINLVLAFVQLPLLKMGILSTGGMGIGDAVQGVFYRTGAGNYVSASVSISFALYYFSSANKAPNWMRFLVLSAASMQLLISDSKQIIFALIAAWVILFIISSTDLSQALKYLIGLILFCWILYWCVQNLAFFSAFQSWARPELYGPNGQGTMAKLAGIRIILSYYNSPWNFFFGLGPGHTIGRLGGWLLRDYWSILGPLGATVHPASATVWAEANQNWLNGSGGSTLFAPFFGWAGIWGDLGFLGLGAYLYLSYLVWQRVCVNDLSRYLLLNILIVGLIFTQMEEPGYMLSVAILLGLQWHEYHNGNIKSMPNLLNTNI